MSGIFNYTLGVRCFGQLQRVALARELTYDGSEITNCLSFCIGDVLRFLGKRIDPPADLQCIFFDDVMYSLS